MEFQTENFLYSLQLAKKRGKRNKWVNKIKYTNIESNRIILIKFHRIVLQYSKKESKNVF